MADKEQADTLIQAIERDTPIDEIPESRITELLLDDAAEEENEKGTPEEGPIEFGPGDQPALRMLELLDASLPHAVAHLQRLMASANEHIALAAIQSYFRMLRSF